MAHSYYVQILVFLLTALVYSPNAQQETDQIILPGLFYFIAPANSYNHTLPTYSIITWHS